MNAVLTLPLDSHSTFLPPTPPLEPKARDSTKHDGKDETRREDKVVVQQPGAKRNECSKYYEGAQRVDINEREGATPANSPSTDLKRTNNSFSLPIKDTDSPLHPTLLRPPRRPRIFRA